MTRAFVVAGAVLLAGALCLAPEPAFPQPTVVTIDVRVPSEGAGGGSLAVRLTIPGPAVGPRYEHGAPLVVIAPGGQGAGGVGGGQSYALQGFVALNFLFPGGTDGTFHSDGTYDYRGTNCILALRDVLLFAGGRTPDVLGRTINRILPFRPLTDLVFLLGSSNGGPISMAVLGLHGSDLPFVAGYVGWENPTDGQTVAVEAGAKAYDCNASVDGDGNGIPNDDGKNPYITSYSDSTVDMDFDRLAWDPTYTWTVVDQARIHPDIVHSGTFFLDGNGNSRVDAVPGNPGCYDLNQNGRLDVGEDYLFRPYISYTQSGGLLLQYSPETTREAWNRNLTGGAWPADIANPAENDTFWSLRESGRFYQLIAAARPDLHCLLAFSAGDHVQADDAHPHIQQAYDNLRAGGLWCRLNPDEAYFRMLVPSPTAPPADNDANLPVAWPTMKSYSEPYGLSSTTASLAGLIEMADRAMAADWSPNLAGAVSGTSDPGGARAAGAPSRLRVTPNPATSSSVLEWAGPTGVPTAIRLFDLSGRLRGDIEPGPGESHMPLGRLFGSCRGCGPGLYWIEATGEADRIRQRVVWLGR